ncbi:PBP1A family penicillin-binding protein [Myxococcota bacterium]|nr:PBP1A family penicillin-binding protein [Myxococcota bacterium]
MGEFFEEQRYVVPYERIPRHVIDAFVAAEDAGFFQHRGVDPMGMARAALRNAREGRLAQGGSTITQQVTRSFLLTREKSFERKLKEVILATRIEETLDKEQILHLYLNQIFLGHGAYGVEAAARLYFGKHVEDLTLAEAALVAGLPQAPSRYTPIHHYDAARARQRYVLDQMADNGFVSRPEAEAAFAEPLCFARKRDLARTEAPHYVEEVRRALVARYGHDAVYREGLEVETAMEWPLQEAAREAVAAGTALVDRRLGYRGPVARLPPEEVPAELSRIDAERRASGGSCAVVPGIEPPPLPPLTEGERLRGVVDEARDGWATVRLGSHMGVLLLSDVRWAVERDPERPRRRLEKVGKALASGDVVRVRVLAPDEDMAGTLGPGRRAARLALEHEVEVDGALLSMRLSDGAVLAMVGGRDFEADEFNLVTQARRQAGSTFKPFVYAAALDDPRRAYTPSTIVLDAPVVGFKEGDGGEREVWKPGNADGDFLGDTTFRRGLILSRNNVTLRILQDIGVPWLREYLGRFGFESELRAELGMGLGSNEVTLWEMVRAYSVFATLGDRRSPWLVARVRDRDGKVLEETREGELAAAMDPATAFVMVNLLTDVVRSGTATRALALEVPLAGKTGTTNGFKDAWFMGFTPEVLSGVWVGFRQPRSLGPGQYGADCALPIWIDYMRAVLPRYPKTDFRVPSGVEWATVDAATGRLARDDSDRRVRVAFREGTAPTDLAPAKGEVDPADFFSADKEL